MMRLLVESEFLVDESVSADVYNFPPTFEMLTRRLTFVEKILATVPLR